MRRSLPVYGVNDPNDRGEVRISFGAFLAAGSEELGDLTSKDPDRARVRSYLVYLPRGGPWGKNQIQISKSLFSSRIGVHHH